jgi:hypothetical protein
LKFLGSVEELDGRRRRGGELTTDTSSKVELGPERLTALSVRRVGGDTPTLTAKRWQRVSIGGIEQLARDTFREFIEEWLAHNPPGALSNWYEGLGIESPFAPPSDRDSELALLANRYVETVGNPKQRDVLAEEFKWTWDTVAKVISECRRRGLTTPTKLQLSICCCQVPGASQNRSRAAFRTTIGARYSN